MAKYKDCKDNPTELVKALADLDGNNLEEMAEFFDIDLQKKGLDEKVDPAAIKKEVGDKCLEAAKKVDPRTNPSLKDNPDAQKAYHNVCAFDDEMQNLEKYAEMAKAEKTEKELDAYGDLFGNKPSKKSKKDPAAAGTTEPAATASEPALSAPANSSSVKPDIKNSDVPKSDERASRQDNTDVISADAPRHD